MLMSMYGIDEEDALGTSIPHQTRSYFMDLVARDNEELLDQFINNQEPMYFSKQRSFGAVIFISHSNSRYHACYLIVSGHSLGQMLSH